MIVFKGSVYSLKEFLIKIRREYLKMEVNECEVRLFLFMLNILIKIEWEWMGYVEYVIRYWNISWKINVFFISIFCLVKIKKLYFKV